jgi:phage shock protein E
MKGRKAPPSYAKSSIQMKLQNFFQLSVTALSLSLTQITTRATHPGTISQASDSALSHSSITIQLGSLTALADAPKAFKNVDVQQFDKLRLEKNSVILDVRTKKEFDEGHIPAAINIDVNAPDFEQKIAKLDKSKTYLVHCAAGVRSVKACNRLASLDFKDLHNLEQGLKAWEKAGKPIQK